MVATGKTNMATKGRQAKCAGVSRRSKMEGEPWYNTESYTVFEGK